MLPTASNVSSPRNKQLRNYIIVVEDLSVLRKVIKNVRKSGYVSAVIIVAKANHHVIAALKTNFGVKVLNGFMVITT